MVRLLCIILKMQTQSKKTIQVNLFYLHIKGHEQIFHRTLLDSVTRKR